MISLYMTRLYGYIPRGVDEQQEKGDLFGQGMMISDRLVGSERGQLTGRAVGDRGHWWVVVDQQGACQVG